MPGTLRRIMVTTLISLMAIGSANLAQAGPSPSITDVVPPQAPSYGGFAVTINGNRFQPGATVTFGGAPAAVVTFVSSSRLDVVTPLIAKGTVDVAVTNPDGKSADLFGGMDFFYNGTGEFEVQGATIPPFTDYSEAAEFGDVDGDGDQDMIVANYIRRNRLYLNDGSGSFTDVTETNMPTVDDRSEDADFGDVNGDGHLDIVVANYAAQNRLYLNDGNGVFTEVTLTNLPPDSDSSFDADLADVDGDNDQDLYVANNGGQQNRLYLNDGNGVFTDVTATHLPAVIDGSLEAAIEDVDGDGYLDIVVANHAAQNRLYLNDGYGVFSDATSGNLPVDTDSSRNVDFADVDHDGDEDILFVTCCAGSGQDRLYLNDGAGVFTDATATNLPIDVDSSTDGEFEDVDGDGYADIVVTNYRQQNRLYLNNGTGVFVNVTATHMPEDVDSSAEADLADIDGDNDPDLVIANNRQNRLLVNDGSGRFTDVTSTIIPSDNHFSMDADFGDVDGDGDLDLAVGNYSESQPWNRLYLNDGTGVLTDATAIALPILLQNTWDIDFADVDGDGDLDLYSANNGPDSLLLNDGTGTFSDVSATNLPSVWTNNHSDFGDVDGDGDLDVFLASGGQQNRLFLNDGNGVFSDATADNLPVDALGNMGSDFGDVDSDGDLDVVIANYGQNLLYTNDGSGVFTDVTLTNMPVDTESGMDVDFGDLDGDGDLDIVVANMSGPNRIYDNDGTGLFTDVTATNLPSSWGNTSFADLGDSDGDGDLDIAITRYNMHSSLFVNDGSGVFTAAPYETIPDYSDWATYRSRNLEFGDADGDGDLDLLIATEGQNRLYHNISVADTEPPTVPDGLAAAAAGCQVDLTWNPATDNVGVSGYTVYRDDIGVDSSPTTTYSDTGLSENTMYCYTLDAYDAAGNSSAQSVAACATTDTCSTVVCENYSDKGLCNSDPDCEWQGSPRNGTCVPIPSGFCTDNDGDGWGDPGDASCPNGAGQDCDDTNFDANLGATEGPENDPTCFDGFDNDCDLLADALDPGCQPPVACGQYPDKTACNADPVCKWDNRNSVCVIR